jgi:dTDP-4-amino-4,6-dideoxygalactose transaminase
VAISAENIDCAVHYPTPLTQQPVVKEMLAPQSCPASEEISKRILSLPMHPALSDEDLGFIVSAVEKVASYYLK